MLWYDMPPRQRWRGRGASLQISNINHKTN